jgi:hypothetical protein
MIRDRTALERERENTLRVTWMDEIEPEALQFDLAALSHGPVHSDA